MSKSLWRGKSSGNGEWIYGSLVENSEGSFILPTDESIFVDWPQMPELGCGIEDRGYQKDGYSAAVYGWEEGLERFNEMLPNWCEVDDDSVGKWTAINDAQYIKIFNGDVVQHITRRTPEFCSPGTSADSQYDGLFITQSVVYFDDYRLQWRLKDYNPVASKILKLKGNETSDRYLAHSRELGRFNVSEEHKRLNSRVPWWKLEVVGNIYNGVKDIEIKKYEVIK